MGKKYSGSLHGLLSRNNNKYRNVVGVRQGTVKEISEDFIIAKNNRLGLFIWPNKGKHTGFFHF